MYDSLFPTNLIFSWSKILFFLFFLFFNSDSVIVSEAAFTYRLRFLALGDTSIPSCLLCFACFAYVSANINARILKSSRAVCSAVNVRSLQRLVNECFPRVGRRQASNAAFHCVPDLIQQSKTCERLSHGADVQYAREQTVHMQQGSSNNSLSIWLLFIASFPRTRTASSI